MFNFCTRIENLLAISVIFKWIKKLHITGDFYRIRVYSMKKFIFLYGIFFLLIQISYSQWVSNYGQNPRGDGNYESAKGLAIAADGSGNCYVAGYSHDEATGDDIIVIKYNSQGDTLWTASYNGEGNLEDRAYALVIDAAGNIYVGGYVTVSQSDIDIILLKYTPGGSLEWAQIYGGYNNGEDKAYALVIDGAGNNDVARRIAHELRGEQLGRVAHHIAVAADPRLGHGGARRWGYERQGGE